MMEMGRSSDGAISQSKDSQTTKNHTSELERLLRHYPQLEQYSPVNLRTKARHTVGLISSFVKKYPDLLEKLRVEQEKTAAVTMLVVPCLPQADHPIVFTIIGQDVVAMSPVLTCSMNAIHDITGNLDSNKGYTIVHSTMRRMELDQIMIEITEDQPNAILSYDREYIAPENYLAAGIKGWFRNEVYRYTLSELQ